MAVNAIVPAIFLDRDGVIIHNRAGYVRRWEDVHIYAGAAQVLARLRDLPYKLVIVTNQAGIGKQLITLETVEAINRGVTACIEQAGGRIDGVYLCPHSSDEGCDCRKPKPGLLLRAARELGIDLSRSYMVGDALSDIEAGQRAGVKTNILVRTGRGRKQEQLERVAQLQPFQVCASLKEAIRSILNDEA